MIRTGICAGAAGVRPDGYRRTVEAHFDPAGIAAVVLDVGETLVDESRAWSEAAHAVGATSLTVAALLGAVIERGEDHRRVWSLLGVPPPAAATIDSADFYPDALDCLRALRASGRTVGIAGNQPESAERDLRQAGVEVDFVASSARWGVAKPDPAFFARVIAAARTAPGAILYVGDRLDNDVLPARAAGMRTALLRRGPWGVLHSARPHAALADLRIDSLGALVAALQPHASARPVTPH